MSTQRISAAGELYFGDVYHPSLFATAGRKGIKLAGVTKQSLGSPATLDADGMIAAATSTELPNAATKTYTTANDGSSPFDNSATPAPATISTPDGSVSVWTLDVPRNITAAVTHGSSVVAMTITITGYDQYLVKLVETLSITAGTTSKSAAGKKAFKHISRIAITSASDATTNTLNLGWGDVLGLPFAISAKSDVMQAWFNDVLETTAPTVVVADANTATATTGDVRGTIDLNSACDGSAVALYLVANPSNSTTLFGVPQYAG